MAQTVKNLPAMWETWVQFLGWEDPLEKEMATQSGVLAWKIPWTEELGRLQSMGVTKSWTQLSEHTHTHTVWWKQLLYELGNKNSCDLLFCDICFTAVLCSRTCSISEVCV